jgi:hypothetical protein
LEREERINAMSDKEAVPRKARYKGIAMQRRRVGKCVRDNGLRIAVVVETEYMALRPGFY